MSPSLQKEKQEVAPRLPAITALERHEFERLRYQARLLEDARDRAREAERYLADAIGTYGQTWGVGTIAVRCGVPECIVGDLVSGRRRLSHAVVARLAGR